DYFPITLGGTTTQSIVNGQPEFTATAGNPFLKPQWAWNYDASYEWYFNKVGSLTFSLFYKQLHDVVVNGTFRQDFTNNGATFSPMGTAPVNGVGVGTVKGFEAAYQQTYDFLPHPFDGLGLSANFTFVDSHGVKQSTLSETDPDVAAGKVSTVDT